MYFVLSILILPSVCTSTRVLEYSEVLEYGRYENVRLSFPKHWVSGVTRHDGPHPVTPEVNRAVRCKRVAGHKA